MADGDFGPSAVTLTAMGVTQGASARQRLSSQGYSADRLEQMSNLQYVLAEASVDTTRIRMVSEESASSLPDLLNSRVSKQLQNSAEALRLTADGADVALQKTLLESSADAARALLELLPPARSGAHRRTVMSQLKQLAPGMHNYHDVHGRFPPQRLVSDDGSPLLSWRVLILPYLGHAKLYDRFRLNEPWDSEHSIRLVTQMPAVFGSPDDPVLTDDAPLFQQIAGDADCFPACACDGAAHYPGRHATKEVMRALVSINGGELVEWP